MIVLLSRHRVNLSRVITDTVSQYTGLDPQLRLLSVSFTYSPCVSVGFCQVLQFLPAVQKHASTCNHYAKLPTHLIQVCVR